LHHGQLICQATTTYVSNEELACSKSATPKHILGVAFSQLLRQWRSWRTGSAAYGYKHCSLMLQRMRVVYSVF